MGRRRLTDAEKAANKLAALLAGTANKVENHVVTQAVEEVRSENFRPPAFWDAEAVLRSLERPAAFTYKRCKRCGEMFGTNYRAVAYCSDHCRGVAFQNQTGIRWNPLRATPEQRWGGEPPLIVPPSVLQLLLPWARHLVAQSQTEMLSEPLESPTQKQPEVVESPFEFDRV